MEDVSITFRATQFAMMCASARGTMASLGRSISSYITMTMERHPQTAEEKELAPITAR